MKALSLDIRQRIVDALCSGHSQPAVARRFAVSVSTVARLKRQWKEDGHLQAKPMPGKARAITDEPDKAALQRLVEEQPDAGV